MIQILMSPDNRAYVRTWFKVDGHWMQQSVAEIKTLKELQEWQLQQCDEFMIGRNPDGETGTPTAPAERT
jgi:hypothetical protein